MKKALTLIGTVSAAFAIAIPAQASFDSWASPHAKAKRTHPAKSVKKQVVKKQQSSRVLCICSTGPVTSGPALSEEELEAQYDQDLIEHGLDPVYGHGPATDTLPAADTVNG